MLRISKALVIVVMAVSLVLALTAPSLLVNLLQIGQIGVSQFVPAVVLGMFWNRLDTPSMLIGLVAGEAIVTWSVLTGTAIVAGLNVGLVALTLNLAITVVGSLIRRQSNSLAPQSIQAMEA